jgi:hypothetical protein
MRYQIILLYISVMLLVFLSSCKKEEAPEKKFKETEFICYQKLSFTFPSVIGINLPFDIAGISVTLDQGNQVENSEPLISLVKNIKLKNAAIKIIQPEGQTFDFIKNLTLYLKKDNLPLIELGHHYNAADNIGNILYLQPADNVLDDYVKDNKFEMVVRVTTDKAIFTDIKVESEMNFFVTLINEN